MLVYETNTCFLWLVMAEYRGKLDMKLEPGNTLRENDSIFAKERERS